MLEISKLSLNIILHVTILFTILTLIFMFYISKLTTSHINNEISHLITDNLKKMLYTSSGEPLDVSLNISNLHKLSSIINPQLQNIINENILNDPTVKRLITDNEDLKTSLSNNTDPSIQDSIKSNIDINNSQLSIKIKDILVNINYNYYINIFNKPEPYRTTVNTNLFNNIKIINIFLVIFLVFFVIILLVTGLLPFSEVLQVFLENIITFLFVGMVEFWFFQNVASKFIPAPPSILFSSLFTSLKKYLNSRIV